MKSNGISNTVGKINWDISGNYQEKFSLSLGYMMSTHRRYEILDYHAGEGEYRGSLSQEDSRCC